MKTRRGVRRQAFSRKELIRTTGNISSSYDVPSTNRGAGRHEVMYGSRLTFPGCVKQLAVPTVPALRLTREVERRRDRLTAPALSLALSVRLKTEVLCRVVRHQINGVEPSQGKHISRMTILSLVEDTVSTSPEERPVDPNQYIICPNPFTPSGGAVATALSRSEVE